MLYSTVSHGQTCPTPFQAVFAAVSEISIPFEVIAPDPDYIFYRETLRFTDAEIEQEKQKAIQHFNTQFGLDFSNVEPDEFGQRVLGNATFFFTLVIGNFTAVSNRWLVSGNTNSKCFNFTGGGFEVNFNGDMMLHGIYGGEEGLPVQEGDTMNHVYLILYDVCDQQPIIFQGQSMIPARQLPVEGWLIQEIQLYNRWLGRGQVHTVVKPSPSQDDPATRRLVLHHVFSFP